MNNQEIVAKLWNLCNVLRDDGITYHQYVTELTYILFLKMCKETGTEGAIPEQYRWDKLLAKQGVELKKLSDLTTRVNLVQNLSTTKELPVSTGAKLLGINRTSVYYGGIPVSEEELECKAVIDHLHTDNPTWGARQMSAQLKLRGYQVGRRKAGRYMREMNITPIYPKMNLSKRMKQAKVCPYLLRNAVIDRPNQAWSIDITYLPMKHGFLYLTAIID